MVGTELREEFRNALKPLMLTSQSEMLESLELTCYALGIPRERFFMCASMDLKVVREPEDLINRRLSGEPLAYIIGEWDFAGSTFKVDRRALIPRDDSNAVLDLFMHSIPYAANGYFLDLCSGTGCLGLSVIKRCKRLSVMMADISIDSLDLAAENAVLLGMEDRVRTTQADVFAPPPFEEGSFWGIICNPPYVRSAEVDRLSYEPLIALDGGEDGLRFYREIISKWSPVLKKGSPLCFEVGYDQAVQVALLLEENGFDLIRSRKDLQGIERAVCGIYTGKK